MLKSFYILIWITVFELCICQKRMRLGNDSRFGKRYLVYFVKSPFSKADDDTWICAGAIISPTQILTAASCLVEMDRIYAIAGYKKYVHASDIENDNCTKTWNKKVVKISVPNEYNTSATDQPDWMNLDVGVATVQEPYNFTDQSYLIHCSYIPQSIKINYEAVDESERTRAVALGWGGRNILNSQDMTKENQTPQILQEASTSIIDSTICANFIPGNDSKEIVTKYFLCASGNGFLTEHGEDTVLDPVDITCPLGRRFNIKNATQTICFDEDLEFRRTHTNINNTEKQNNKTEDTSHTIKDTRRSALMDTCLNDHGSPLVTWFGSQEMIFGVALNGIANPNFDCVGPRIYVSAAKAEKIFKCLLETNDTRRKTCNEQIDENKYQIHDEEIKWPEYFYNKSSEIKQKRFSRQAYADQPLQVRPTKDLGNIDELENLKHYETPDKQGLNPQNGNPYYQLQNQQSQSVNEQLQGAPQGQMQQPKMGQPQTQSFNQQQTGFNHVSRETGVSQNPQIVSYNQPNINPQNQPPVDLYNQPQINNQPQMEPQPPLQSGNLNQPQNLILSYNQPNAASYNQPQIVSYSQSAELGHQPPMDPNIQPQGQSLNPQQMESQHQLQGHMFNNPQMTAYNPQIESLQQPQPGSFNPQNMQPEDVNQPHGDPMTQAQAEPLMQSHSQSFNQPQGVPLNNPEVGGHSDFQPNRQIAPFQMQPPADTYNPIEMSPQNQNGDRNSFKDVPQGPYQQSNADFMVQPSVVTKLNDQANQGVKDQQNTHQEGSFGLQQQQPLSKPLDQGRSSLRDRPVGSGVFEPPPVDLDSALGEPPMFEQMYSQLQNSEVPRQGPQSPEQTFEELYKNLHDDAFDLPHEEQLDLPAKVQRQPLSQTFGNTNPVVPTALPQKVKQDDEIKVRPQMPLEYPEYMPPIRRQGKSTKIYDEVKT